MRAQNRARCWSARRICRGCSAAAPPSPSRLPSIPTTPKNEDFAYPLAGAQNGDVDDGVGNKLRDARARRKLSLQEAEDATKIRARYLRAIENEDWDELPGDTYARAFIRTYGALLGLDGDRLAEEQRQLRGSARPGERLPRVDPRPRKVVPA